MAPTAMSLQDVKDRYEGDLTTRFTNQYLVTKLADAEALVVSDAPLAATRREAGLLSDNDYFRVVTNIFLRVVRNPGGMKSETEAGAGYVINTDVASGDMFITDREYKTLTGLERPKKPQDAVIGSYGIGLDTGWGTA